MNFFRALIGTCKGTGVFIRLLPQSAGKALWHLVLLAVISSLFILLCSYSDMSDELDETFRRLKENFGNIIVDSNGVRPQNMNRQNSLLLANNRFRVNYVPSVEKDKLPEIDAGEVNMGFLWTPVMLSSWIKTGDDKFLLIPYAYCSGELLPAVSKERSAIMPYIKDNTSLKHKLFCQFSALNWQALNDYCKSTYISVSFLGNLFGTIFQVLFFVTMFSFILNLSGNTGRPVLKYRERFVIGIYASFPPILIASFFPAFDLPFLSFNSVYIICFSLYLIIVFTRLQLDLNLRAAAKLK
ncbi:MAG: hypothetical protein PHV82_12330 [Victivallaceae bacterium]|nr:hypothetical protein [Victivallaceae bacterium]